MKREVKEEITKELRRQYIKAARELYYDDTVINLLKLAETENEMVHIMSTARKRIISSRDKPYEDFEQIRVRHKKPVWIVETGDVFESISECARAINGDRTKISVIIDDPNRTYRGYHFVSVVE